MGKLRYLLTTISALTFGTSGYPVHAAVTADNIERDCKLALEERSIEALEEFFLKYPPHEYRGKDIACYTIALSAYDRFGPIEVLDEGGAKPPGSGYAD
jgi:hypothetical protein